MQQSIHDLFARLHLSKDEIAEKIANVNRLPDLVGCQ